MSENEKRDETLSRWHLRKEIFVKGAELFQQIDPYRAENDELLKEAAMACAAIDRLVSGGHEKKSKEEEEEMKRKIKQKTMKSLWQKWTSENHTFSMVSITDEEYRPFSGAVKEMLEKGEDGNYVFLSLKYAFPGVPKPGEKAKPITNDQRLQNAIFTREMIKLWKEAKEELRLRVLEDVTRAQRRASLRSENKDEEHMSMDEIAMAAERNILVKLSIKRFKQWVEDDEDKKAEAEKEKMLEKQQEAKISHEQYVKKKDSLRIRLPPPDYDPRAMVSGRPRPKSAGPSMSFGRTQGVRKKQEIGSQTTVDLMRNSGEKSLWFLFLFLHLISSLLSISDRVEVRPCDE